MAAPRPRSDTWPSGESDNTTCCTTLHPLMLNRPYTIRAFNKGHPAPPMLASALTLWSGSHTCALQQKPHEPLRGSGWMTPVRSSARIVRASARDHRSHGHGLTARYGHNPDPWLRQPPTRRSQLRRSPTHAHVSFKGRRRRVRTCNAPRATRARARRRQQAPADASRRNQAPAGPSRRQQDPRKLWQAPASADLPPAASTLKEGTAHPMKKRRPPPPKKQ